MIPTKKKDILKLEGEFIICHQVNCQGVMGAGLALKIARKWPNVERAYHTRLSGDETVGRSSLGECQLVNVGYFQFVANLFGQKHYGTHKRMTNYGALASALCNLRDINSRDIPIYIPYNMGCGLAGGEWGIVKELIEFILKEHQVTFCRL